ncbi:septum site-determining protein MinC [bacterium]|nr:septum site-determining protein MinC [bacterium]
MYKKAYDDNTINHEWEDVDFYESPTDEHVVSDTKTTTYINQTLRSGQVLESEGNVVVIGDCHPGSEIRAVGDITVWGVLSGIAHAGCKGNANSKIGALKMNAVQLRIANCYSRRPDSTNIPYIIRSSVFTPEEARIVEDDIVLFKINQN